MALFSLFERENLYLPGCFSEAFLRFSINNYKRILKKLDINFRTINDNFCCAGILEEAGYEKQVRRIARDNFNLLNDKGIKRIITSCPNCYRMLHNNYKEIMPDWNIQVEFILQPILEAIKNNKNKIGDYFGEPIFYYDSCYLSRYMNFYDTPREILKIIGFRVLELTNNHEETLCCGSCGSLPVIDIDLSKKICRKFIEDIKRQKVKKITTADCLAYKHLKDNITKEDGIEVLDFSQALCEALGLKKEIPEEEEENKQ